MVEWLSGIDAVAGIDPQPASVDASFRRYFRLRTDSQSFIAMDAPPQQEDCMPFIHVAGYLQAMNLNAPRVIAANPEQGFLLLTDLGTTHYLDKLQQEPGSAGALYTDALRALSRMHTYGSAYQSSLPSYDEKLLRFELSLFHDWLCGKHLGIDFGAADEARWQALCDLLVANALEQPSVFVHRDYHSRNLMFTARNNPGILDFQDAVEGPLTYDLVSLLKDCYVRWLPEQVSMWARDYYAMLDAALQQQIGVAQFLRYFDLMGVQRHLKAAGIFARLNHRDGKSAYLRDIPRTLHYIVELEPQYKELAHLIRLINAHCLPAFEETH